jgi:hypothetical protein
MIGGRVDVYTDFGNAGEVGIIRMNINVSHLISRYCRL